MSSYFYLKIIYKENRTAPFGWVSGVQLTRPCLAWACLVCLIWLARLSLAWEACSLRLPPFRTKKPKKIIEKDNQPRKNWSLAWFSENRPTYGDFEISLSTLQLHQTFKPIRLLTRTKRYTDQVYIYFKLIHTRFLANLKQLLGSFLPSWSS